MESNNIKSPNILALQNACINSKHISLQLIMSSVRFLVRPLITTAKNQPFARIAYKNAFIRPVMAKTFSQPATIAMANNSRRAFSVSVPRFSSGDGRFTVPFGRGKKYSTNAYIR